MEPKNNKMNIEPASTTVSANKKNTTSTKGNKKKVQKKHHDRKNANPKAYRFGIPSSAILKEKEVSPNWLNTRAVILNYQIWCLMQAELYPIVSPSDSN